MADDNSCRNSCMGLLFIVGIALFAASFDTVEPTQMGILRDDISKSIDPTKVYFGGRYFVGLGKGFVRYPTTLQFLAADNVEAATKDKLSVSIEVALQYKLDPKKIHVLYSERQTSYQSFLERTLVETIKEVCVNYQTKPDFYEKREVIAAGMETALASAFSDNYAILVGFQLLKIDLPSATESAIVASIVQQELAQTESQIQLSDTVRKSIEEVQADAIAEVDVKKAKANAEATLVIAGAQAAATQRVIDAQSESLLSLAQEWNMSVKELLRYIWYSKLNGQGEQTSMVLGFDGLLGGLLGNKLSS